MASTQTQTAKPADGKTSTQDKTKEMWGTDDEAAALDTQMASMDVNQLNNRTKMMEVTVKRCAWLTETCCVRVVFLLPEQQQNYEARADANGPREEGARSQNQGKRGEDQDEQAAAVF